MPLITDHPRAGAGLPVPPSGAVPVPGPVVDRDLLLAGFAALLHRHTGEAELALACWPAGQLRLAVDRALSLAELLATVSRLEPGPGCQPTAQPAAGSVAGFADRSPPAGWAELTLVCPPGEPAWLEFDPRLFERASIGRLAGQLSRLVQADPAGPVGAVELLDEAERALVRDRFNDTARPYPRAGTVSGLFAEQVLADPDAPAVSDQAGELSYAELAGWAGSYADRLHAAGVRPGDPVGLLARRSPAMVAAALGILQLGASYLPIDVDYPAERVAFQLSDSGATALVTDLTETDRTIEFAGPVLNAGDQPARDWLISQQTVVGPARPAGPAYLMYTSGTTGRPKAVAVGHRGVLRLAGNPDYLSFGPDTRMLAISSICFDASTFELWTPLLNGGSVHLGEAGLALDAARLGRQLSERAITTLLLIAPVFNHLVEQDPAIFGSLRELMVGGDALSARHLGAVLDACPRLVLLNGYGPTENTTLASTHRITRADLARVPIGRPVANSTCYLLEESGQLCPVGMPGELYLGGDGVAQGYLHRPGLTAAAFVPDPTRPGQRLFRTGDLARWRPDGALEFLGRIDRQVKVRGFRIELGEVEHALREHPDIAEAVVLARPRPGGADRYLIAYLVAGRELPVAELRAQLAARLPEHMLPARFVQLPAMPLNASSKIDLDRLAALEPAAVAADPPAGPTQLAAPAQLAGPAQLIGLAQLAGLAQLVGLVQDALGPPAGTVGIDDDLRELGADSFSAALLATAIAGQLGVRLSPVQLLRAGTVRRIAALVAGAPLARAAAPSRLPDAPHYPVSPQQRRLYVEQLKHPGAVQYHVPVLIELPAELAADRLAAALAQLTDRHEALRTEFVLREGQLRQRIAAALSPPLTMLAGQPPPAGDWRPFELDRAPLWRATGYRSGAGTTLLLELHHLITDGASLAVLAEELLILCAGGTLPAPPPLRYRDYAGFLISPAGLAWQDGQAEHWRRTLTAPRRRADLPLDQPRPALRSVAGGELAFNLDAATTAGLQQLARRTDTTLFAVLAAGYLLLLAELTGQPEVTVGTPMAGRSLPGLDRTVGLLATTVCLRVTAEAQLSFQALVQAVARAGEQAAEHQNYPLDQLVGELEPGRDYRRQPLFDALIAVHSARYLSVAAAGHRAWLRPLWNGQTPFDLNLQLYQEPAGLRASLQYGSAILRESTVAGWRDRLLDLLAAAIADPAAPLGALIAAGRTVPDLEFDL